MPEELTFMEYMAEHWPENSAPPLDAHAYITFEEGKDFLGIYQESITLFEEFLNDLEHQGKPVATERIEEIIEEIRLGQRVTDEHLNAIISEPWRI